MGGVVLGEHAEPALSRPSATQDAEILNFALLLEHVQSAFYAEALQRAGLTGELLRRSRRRSASTSERTSTC